MSQTWLDSNIINLCLDQMALEAMASDDIKLFFKNGRINTFKNWRLDREKGTVCTSEKVNLYFFIYPISLAS